mmetsp:Transcript_82476/g.229929  ORF Transcript_82476/g.229929 Transcript_82476/m.229929 type:complete len:584 (-) Transcript_82476:100-1851(-)
MRAADDAADAEAREAARLERENVIQEYLEGLPSDTLTPEEDELLQALLVALDEAGGGSGVRLSLVAQRSQVRNAKAALRLPQGLGLTQWIQHRVPNQVDLVPDSVSGEYLLCHPNSSGAQADSFETFVSQLPEDRFVPKELALRELLLNALQNQGGKAKVSVFSRDRDIQAAKSALLPKGTPLMIWIERRLSSEVAISPEPLGGNSLELLVEAPPMQKAKGTEKGKSYGKGKDKDGKSRTYEWSSTAAKGANERSPSVAASRGRDRSVVPSSRELKKLQPVPMTDEEKEEARLAREARSTEFFQSLPQDEFTVEEQALYKALQEAWLVSHPSGVGPETRLSMLCQNEGVRMAKGALLPEGVTVGAWIGARVGPEMTLSKDSTGQAVIVVSLDGTPPAEGTGMRPSEERDARMAAYFQGPLSRLEQDLRYSVIDALTRRQAGCEKPNTAIRLSDLLNLDPSLNAAWKTAKASWLALDPPLEVSLARWVELRIQEDLRVTREPYVQFTRPPGTERKRKGEPSGREPPYKAYRQETDGKGLPAYRPTITESWTSHRGGAGAGGKAFSHRPTQASGVAQWYASRPNW